MYLNVESRLASVKKGIFNLFLVGKVLLNMYVYS